MTTPGRAVPMIILILFAARSISIRETPACFNFSRKYLRSLKSSWRFKAYCLPLANQRESHVLMTPTRRPIGLTFCPTLLTSHPIRRLYGSSFYESLSHDLE